MARRRSFNVLLYTQVVAVTVTEVGDPKEAVCEAVEKFKINLLILGNHGRGVLQRYVCLLFIPPVLVSMLSLYCKNMLAVDVQSAFVLLQDLDHQLMQ